MKVIALAGSKGGTGKTTTALNLSVALAEHRHKVLLVDVDPQGAIGLSLARQDTEWAGLVEYALGQSSIDESLVKTKLEGLTLLPRGRLDPVDTVDYELALLQSDVLGNALRELGPQFDYAVIDTPAGLGISTRAALNVANYVLVLIQAQPLALRSVTQVLRVVEHIQEQRAGSPKLLGLLATMVELEQGPSLSVMREMWTGFSGILDSYIPRADIFAKASEAGLPVSFLGGPPNAEERRYDILAIEIEQTIAEMEETTGEDYERPQRAII